MSMVISGCRILLLQASPVHRSTMNTRATMNHTYTVRRNHYKGTSNRQSWLDPMAYKHMFISSCCTTGTCAHACWL